MKIFISNWPFGKINQTPIKILQETGWEIILNPLNRKLTSDEVAQFTCGVDGLIAGTEDLTKTVIQTNSLKIISRTGIGLDSVPLQLCREKGIEVTYTPDAVTKAVAELTIAAMLSLTRYISIADKNIRRGQWQRFIGKRLEECIIGIIGFGRVGNNVAHLLKDFHPQTILVNDILDKTKEYQNFQSYFNIQEVSQEEIFTRSNVITIHTPLTSRTRNLVNKDTLKLMQDSTFLINYARGGIVNEKDLYQALKNHLIAGAAIDVFNEEPYSGPLTELDNILLTQHMGSCSEDCRYQMELQAAQDIIRFFQQKPLIGKIPQEEYDLR